MQFIIIFTALLLTACTTTQPLQVTVPCPKPNIPAEPHYPAQDLKQGDSPATVAKAYVATVKGQRGYIEQLRYVLEGYQ